MDSDGKTHSPLVVALTGGIASGKSAVSDRFARLGAPIVDTDLIARQVVEPGCPALEEIAETFGDRVIDRHGQLDRAALGSVVFEDESARHKLEALLHPRIAREARSQIALHRDAPYVIVVVPLLVETGLFADAGQVIVVDVPESVQTERLMAREGIDREKAGRLLAAQAARAERLAAATEIIDNTGTLAELDCQVERLHAKFSRLSRRHHPASGDR